MSPSIATMMYLYKIRKEDAITKFFGILHFNDNHFISVFIDIEEQTVDTCDSYHTGKGISDVSTESDESSEPKESSATKMIVLMRKWIAKSMSIIDYLDNKKDNEKELSYWLHVTRPTKKIGQSST